MTDEAVQTTADGLTALRAGSDLARELDMSRPYDHLFLSDAGSRLAAMALENAQVYQDELMRARALDELHDRLGEQVRQLSGP